MRRLIEDSRQQAGKHELKHAWWAQNEVVLTRCKLPVGDYALPPAKAIDTKAGLQEIAQNIGGTREEHERFIRELKLAQEIGTQLYILIETEDDINEIDDIRRWRNPRLDFSPKAIPGERLAKAMHTIERRYGCTFLFCRPEEAADTIIDLLR